MERVQKLRKKSKGERLNWTPMKDVTNIKVSTTLANGKWLSKKELNQRRLPSDNTKLIVF